MLPIECVVRGYLSGSGWKDYLATGEVCGHRLPDRARRVAAAARADLHAVDEGDRRATTRTSTAPRPSELVGEDALRRGRAGSRSRSTSSSRSTRATRGIILADTKLEFGLDRRRAARARRRGVHARLVALLAGRRVRSRAARSRRSTSSSCATTASQLGWDKTPPGPELPDDVVAGTRGALRRGVRAADRDRRSTTTSPIPAVVCA